MSKQKVKLRAGDPEDLAIIAALLQDARSKLKEMVFQPEEERFIAVFTRYRREAQPEWTSCEHLTECETALVFEQIKQVKFRGLDPNNPEQDIQLLTIATSPNKDTEIAIELVMAGKADIRLASDVIDCRLDDFGEPQPARESPYDHFADGDDILGELELTGAGDGATSRS